MTTQDQFDPAAANEMAARWLGWTTTPNPHCDWSDYWVPPQRDGERKGKERGDSPKFDKQCHLWPQVHAELQRRDLWFRYTLAVFNVVGDPQHEDANYRYFQLLVITPEQRLRALVKLIEKEKK